MQPKKSDELGRCMAWINPVGSSVGISPGCVCHGCVRLEILTNKHKAVNPTRYYCRDKHHGFFDPNKQRECNMRKTQEDIELQKAKFNLMQRRKR